MSCATLVAARARCGRLQNRSPPARRRWFSDGLRSWSSCASDAKRISEISARSTFLRVAHPHVRGTGRAVFLTTEAIALRREPTAELVATATRKGIPEYPRAQLA